MDIKTEIARITRLSGSAVSDAQITRQARANVEAFHARQSELARMQREINVEFAAVRALFEAADIAAGW